MRTLLQLNSGEAPEQLDCDRDVLLRKIRRLEDDLAEARSALQRARDENELLSRPVSNIRKQLQPMYTALRALFGEIEAVAEDSPAGAISQEGDSRPIAADAYAAWKERLPPSCGKIIDALLIQPLSSTQIKSFCKLGSGTVSENLAILRRNNLLEKVGGLNRLRRI